MSERSSNIIKSNYFINKLQAYLRESIPYVSDSKKEVGKLLLTELERYQEIEDLKCKRNMYYNFYVRNRNSNLVDANIAYKMYKEVNEKLEQIQGN